MTDSLPRAVGLLQAGQAGEAEQMLDRLLASNPDDVEALHLRGIARGKLGAFEPGAEDLRRAAVRHSQPEAVYNNLGNLLRNAGKLDQAIEAYREAISLKSDFVDARFNLALCLDGAGRLDDAEHACLDVLRLRPDHAAALNSLGTLSSRRNRPDAAREYFDRALAQDPGFVIARINRGVLLRSLGDLEAARTDLEVAVRQAPHLAEAAYQLASLLRSTGQTPDAKQAYLAALNASPLRADIHKDYASLCWELGEGEQSTEAFDQVLARHPDSALYVARAEVLMRTARPEAAEQSADQAVLLDTQNAKARFLRGDLRFRLGQREAGLEDMEVADNLSQGQDISGLHQLCEALLVEGQPEAVLRRLEHEPAAEHLQKHVALKALAWRLMGNPEYRSFYDYDRFTRKLFIETPPGYQSLDAFNAALATEIARLHATETQPIDQTLFGGTQSVGRLWDETSPVIKSLSDALLSAARVFVESLPDDDTHPFLRRKASDLELSGAWSVRLRSGGGHVDHVHPAGWISACYYVEVPQSVMAGERSGWLRLGASGVSGLDLEAERYVKPEPGAVVFFPSYMWHGVEAFESPETRVTAPFDLLPV